MILDYKIPGRFNFDFTAKTSSISLNHTKDKIKHFVFNNTLSSESCAINIEIINEIALNSLIISCKKDCYIIYNSKKLTSRDLRIKGKKIELNAAEMKAD